MGPCNVCHFSEFLTDLKLMALGFWGGGGGAPLRGGSGGGGDPPFSQLSARILYSISKFDCIIYFWQSVFVPFE